jgi:hypothetical protein
MDVRYRLRKRPRVSRKVNNVALSFAVRVSRRLLRDLCPVIPRFGAKRIDIFDTNGNRALAAQLYTGFVEPHFSYDHGSISDIQLDAVITDPETNSKSERITEPSCSPIHIWIGEHRMTVARGIDRFANMPFPLNNY